MHKDFDPQISIEEFAAYLDGNLSDAKMIEISELIANNETLSELVNTNEKIEDNIAINSAIGNYEYPKINFETIKLPQVDSVKDEPKEILLYGDIFDKNDSSLDLEEAGIPEEQFKLAMDYSASNEIQNSYAHMKEQNKSFKGKVNYGYEANHKDSTFDWNIYQGEQPSCAVRSQEIILRDYGIMIPQEELIQYAVDNGWYSPDPENGGTPRDATGNLLDAMGIATRRYDNATIYDVISELRAGHRVIVSVDANELWVKKEPSLYKRLFGELSNRLDDKMDELAGVQGANHALIVAGVNVDTDNPSDMKVVLIDSGTGDVCIEYKFPAFKKAWDDSHCHMVATTEPAPFQYNYETQEMEPSSFQTDFKPSMASLPLGLHNQFELPESYFDQFGDVERVFNDSDHLIPVGEELSELYTSGCASNNPMEQSKENDMDDESVDEIESVNETYDSEYYFSNEESAFDSPEEALEEEETSDSDEEDTSSEDDSDN